MIQLRDIMSGETVTVSPELGIREAIDLVLSRGLSGVPVIDGGEMVGVVMADDLLCYAAARAGVLTESDEAETDGWISTDPVEDEPYSHTFDPLENRLDAQFEGDEPFASDSDRTCRYIADHSVGDVMSRQPLCKLSPDTSVPAAADFMRQHRVEHILVTDGGQDMGLVTAGDLAKAIAVHGLTARLSVVNEESGVR